MSKKLSKKLLLFAVLIYLNEKLLLSDDCKLFLCAFFHVPLPFLPFFPRSTFINFMLQPLISLA